MMSYFGNIELQLRAMLAETRAQGGDIDGDSNEAVRAALANVKCKRMPIRDQNVSDACVYTVKNTGFHMASELSLNRDVNQSTSIQYVFSVRLVLN